MKTKDDVKKSESQELRTRLADGLSDILYLPFVFIDIPGSFVQKRGRRRAGSCGHGRLGIHRNAEVRSDAPARRTERHFVLNLCFHRHSRFVRSKTRTAERGTFAGEGREAAPHQKPPGSREYTKIAGTKLRSH